MSNLKEMGLGIKDVAHLHIGSRIRGMKTGRLLVLEPNTVHYADFKPSELMLVLKRCERPERLSLGNVLSAKQGYDVLGLINQGLAIASDDPAYFPDEDAYEMDCYHSFGSLNQIKITNKKKSANDEQ